MRILPHCGDFAEIIYNTNIDYISEAAVFKLTLCRSHRSLLFPVPLSLDIEYSIHVRCRCTTRNFLDIGVLSSPISLSLFLVQSWIDVNIKSPKNSMKIFPIMFTCSYCFSARYL